MIFEEDDDLESDGDKESVFLSYYYEDLEEADSTETETPVPANPYLQISRRVNGVEREALIDGLSTTEIEILHKVCCEATATYRLLSLISREEIKPRRSARGAIANCPSPIHPLRSASLRVDDLDGDYFVCEECGASGGALEFIGLVYGVASLGEQFRLLTGTTLESKIPEGQIKEITQVGKCRREEVFRRVAEAEHISLVYQALLSQLICLESHYQEIKRQYSFLSDESFSLLWRARQYRSLPSSIEERIEISESLRMEFDLGRVPGFFRIPNDAPDKDTRGYWCFGGDRWGRRAMNLGKKAELALKGFLVPVCDIAGCIVGLELYNDSPSSDTPISVRQLWPQRRIPLQANHAVTDMLWSATGGVRLHYAPPPRCNIHPDDVVVTSGALRADVIAVRYDYPVFGAQFGLLMDEVFEAMSYFKRMFIIADCADEVAVKELCYEAERRSISTQVLLHDPRDQGAYIDVWPFYKSPLTTVEDEAFLL